MEESLESLFNLVPINLRGVDVLVVHDDKVTLTYLSSLLEQYSFKVTISDVAAEAISIINNEEGKFKLVIAKANMPGMDIIYFLDLLLQKGIPLICTYYGGHDDENKEASIGGVVFILQEPIHLQDLKYVWQHLYHTGENLESSNPNTNCKDKVDEAKARKRILDDNKDNPIEKITQITSDNINDHQVDQKKIEESREDNNNESASEEDNTKRKKKRTRVWTTELHQRFTEVLSELGGRRNPKAKEVLNKMNVPYLTVRQVASHMQRHKFLMQRERDSITPTVTRSSNYKGRIEFPTPFASSRLGTTGVTTLPTSLIEDDIRNQFTVDVAKPLHCQETLHSAASRYRLLTRFSNDGSRNADATIGNHLLTASRSQNQSPHRPLEPKTMQGTQDNANFHYGLPMGLANYGNQNMDVLQNGVPATLVNQNKYPFQLQTTQGYGTFSSDLPIRLANYGNQNLDNPTQNSVLVASIIPNESQAIANFPSEFSIGLANHGSQNIETGLQNHVPIGLTNFKSQNLDVDVNNLAPSTLTNQNQSHHVDPFEWARKLLLEDD